MVSNPAPEYGGTEMSGEKHGQGKTVLFPPPPSIVSKNWGQASETQPSPSHSRLWGATGRCTWLFTKLTLLDKTTSLFYSKTIAPKIYNYFLHLRRIVRVHWEAYGKQTTSVQARLKRRTRWFNPSFPYGKGKVNSFEEMKILSEFR